MRLSSTVYAISYVTIWKHLFLDISVFCFYVDLCYQCTVRVIPL